MAFVNFATREITAKIVYYGPGLGGKTTSLQFIHNNLAPENKGKMISLATEEDRTIYFDFLPLNLGKIQEFAVRVQLYTVPGQVRYNATRKLVLRGADGLVFVADAQRLKKLGNLESFNNMEENLRELGKDLKDLPHVLQFNKMDLPDVMASEEMNQILNRYNVPFFETVATTGIGVLDALKSITKLVFNDLSKKALLQKRSRTTTSLYTAGGTAIDQPLPAAKRPEPTPAASALISPLPFTPASRVATPPPPAAPEPIHTVEPEPEIKIESEIEEDPLAALEPELPDTLETTPNEPAEVIQEVEPLAEFDEMTDETSALKVSPFHEEPVEEPTYDLVADDTEDVEEDSQDVTFEEESVADDTVIELQPQPEPQIEPEIEPELEQQPTAEPSLLPFSYETMFEEGDEFSSLMQTLEQQIAEKKYTDALSTARNGYSHLLTKLYPKQDILDGNEALKIFALDIKFRRFLRFKRLLDSDPDPQNLLYIHHFLCDLYLSLKEL
ncbi:MAG TPA: ADP-ribosylation factor-like protein [Acidobacteriota bacterium]|nr:ADP-ribosylation factor-like protein [Acidobacteriota bacterium]